MYKYEKQTMPLSKMDTFSLLSIILRHHNFRKVPGPKTAMTYLDSKFKNVHKINHQERKEILQPEENPFIMQPQTGGLYN